jgi:SSS family solute:Na+ symporter
MYTDAFQGVIMFAGMVTLLALTYTRLGGVAPAHRELTALADLVPANLAAIGHQGWTAMPAFGFGDRRYNLWWIVVSTIVLGVGVGVLAQPQLIVRFMTVKSRRELNRAVGVGAVFILAMVGVAYTTGALSNVFFTRHGPVFQGRVVQALAAHGPHARLQLMKPTEGGQWLDVIKETSADGRTTNILRTPGADATGRWLPVSRTTNHAGVVCEGVTVPVVLAGAEPKARLGPNEVREGRTISVVAAGNNPDQIIPAYIRAALPPWFGLVFLLTLLAAAMSTLSSQFHTLGTAVGRDVYQQVLDTRRGGPDRTIPIVRVAILAGLLAAVAFGYYARGEYIIARATAIFFGLCAATFLPAFLGGLYWPRMTRAGAVASMIVGLCASLAWVALVKTPECTAIGLVKASLLEAHPNWPVVDPVLLALPLSALTAVVVSLLTRPPPADHLARCFNPQPH